MVFLKFIFIKKGTRREYMKKYNLKSEANVIGILFAITSTFIARFLGFIREMIVANVFGTSSMGDAFIVAFSIPDLLVTGVTAAIATLYIPTYYKILSESRIKKSEIKDFNTSVLQISFLICLLITVGTEVFTDLVVKMFASGFDSESLRMTVYLLRIMIVSTISIGLSGVFKAYGQIVNKFSIMTLFGSVINLSVIIALFIWKSSNLTILALSVVFGNFIYAIISFSLIYKNNFRCACKINLNNKYLQGMFVGIVPVFVSNIISEINQMIDKNFASQLAEGTISALNYSSKIINLITATIGTAISSVLFAYMSKIAAGNNRKIMAREVARINSIVITIIIPLFLYVLFFSKSIVAVLFQRGSFNYQSVIITSECLKFYAISIIGFNLKAIWIRIYNALLDTKTQAINTAIAVICNVILNFIFMEFLKHKGIALATGISSIITDVLLILGYCRKNHEFKLKQLIIEFFKVGVSSLSFILVWFPIDKMISNYSSILIILKWCLWFMSGGLFYVFMLVIVKSKIGCNLRDRIKGKET